MQAGKEYHYLNSEIRTPRRVSLTYYVVFWELWNRFAHHRFDGTKRHLFSTLFSAYPNLIHVHLKSQADFSAVFIQHARQWLNG